MTDGIFSLSLSFSLSLVVPLPSYWIPQPKDYNGKEKTVHLYQLHPINNTMEYQRVESHFKKSCSNHIVKIERVQNPALYRTYSICKQSMDEEKGSNEKWLFHRIPGENCHHVNHTGFDRDFHGRSGKAKHEYNLYSNGEWYHHKLVVNDK